ncbi:hypothetical protein I302_105718 [Kwoniella bestiolae CBS 10118]|uniref:Uncharacterized protein n=1 Tax=Kwoniella bestiolae CBS 10118 TaxID=1296100 RepID=A0A1B9G205_9TREE|nr:hypothetical protein I302_04838 [Kwoniella bestiolae CBS 10118]OCF25028.1 hypothetical protein I302_04838 [Kwoniella bestiolae CBS 10118]
MTVALEVRKAGEGIGGSGLAQKDKENEVDIWSKEYNIINEMAVPPPPIPARSRLRSVPSKQLLEDHDRTSSIDGPSNMKIITHKQSNLSLFKLPVDPPLTPTPISPTSSTSIRESPSSDGAFGSGKRKGSKAVERDPLKVRDGLQAKESTSGVYTPSTFPGAQGPRPSHFPTHVYTPTKFSLYPQTGYPVSPSGSSSSSQSDSTAPPKTPLSPTGRLSKAVSSNMRRLSSGIVSLKDRTSYGSTTPTTHQRSVTTPMLESGEYNYRFPTSDSYETNYGGTGHSRESSSSWASWSAAPRIPPSSGSSYFPPVSSPVSGLGMEIDTHNDKTVVIDSSMDPDSVNFAVPAEPRSPALGLGPGSGSLAGKGKRKPVPRLGGEEVQVHAM